MDNGSGCHKLQYRTEREAKIALVDAITTRNAKGRNQRKECRYYVCPVCHYWHLTSLPKPPVAP